MSSTPTEDRNARPPQRVDEQSQIAGVANDAVDARGNQRVPLLDRHQSAESMAEHEDRPDSQCATYRKQEHAEPTDRVTIKSP